MTVRSKSKNFVIASTAVGLAQREFLNGVFKVQAMLYEVHSISVHMTYIYKSQQLQTNPRDAHVDLDKDGRSV